jgi:hypothetical protein
VSRIWLRLLALAAPLSFGWEMLQAPGFTGMPRGWVAGTAVCALAALGDTLILLSLFGLGWLAFWNARWFVPPRLGPYALVVLASVTVQVPLEWLMVHRVGRWGYGALQPVLPVLDVGLFPVLQAVAVPPLVFWLLACWESPSKTPAVP